MGASFLLLGVVAVAVILVMVMAGLLIWHYTRKRPEPRGFEVQPIEPPPPRP
jgi:hypothetical protein